MKTMQYAKGVIREFKNIRWLSLRRVVHLSIIVIIVGIISGFILGAIDSGFANLLRQVLI